MLLTLNNIIKEFIMNDELKSLRDLFNLLISKRIDPNDINWETQQRRLNTGINKLIASKLNKEESTNQ